MSEWRLSRQPAFYVAGAREAAQRGVRWHRMSGATPLAAVLPAARPSGGPSGVTHGALPVAVISMVRLRAEPHQIGSGGIAIRLETEYSPLATYR